MARTKSKSKKDVRRRVFLVDFENVKSAGLNGILGLTEDDTVCFFYSENAETMTFGLHRRLTETKANVQYQKVEVGVKNALDFQLSSYLGYVISQNLVAGLEHVSYYIVTNDRGFACLKTYWKKRNIEVNLVSEITVGVQNEAAVKELPEKEPAKEESKQVKEEPKVEKQPANEDAKKPPKKTQRRRSAKKSMKESPKDELTLAVENVLEDKSDVPFIVKCINHYKTKSGVNNALMKEFKDAKKAGEVYSAIKPLIKDKKGR